MNIRNEKKIRYGILAVLAVALAAAVIFLVSSLTSNNS